MIAVMSSPGTVLRASSACASESTQMRSRLEELGNPSEELFEPEFDPAAELGVEPHPVGAGLHPLALDAHLRDPMGPERLAHRVEALHLHRDGRGGTHVATDSGGVVAVEEQTLAGERREVDHDVDLALGLPHAEPVFDRDRLHEPTRVTATLDRGDVDRHSRAQPVEGDRVARLVDGDGVTLTLDVLPVVGEPVLLDVLRRQHVGPRDRVAAFADGVDQGFVHRVLDRRTGGVRRDDRELLEVGVGEHVLHPAEVSLERALPAFLRRVADLVLAVEAARAQQRGVE